MSKMALFSNVQALSCSLFDDVFILFKGAEDRSYTVFEKYLEIISPKEIIMFDSRLRNESLSSNELNKYNSINEIIAQKENTIVKMVSIENSSVGKNLSSESFTDSTSVAVDISSMNFWEICDILYFLLKIVRVKHIDVFYTEPDLYHYENNDISSYNHSCPKVSVNYISSYYSTNTTDKEILVSMLGFQKDVNKLLKDIFEVPQYYSINGFPSFYPKAKDISQANNWDYLAEIESANRFSAEAINPFVTFNTLLDIRKASKGAFMNICPLCSKPMVVGACLYALSFPNSTRLVYPYEEAVATKTDGVGRTYCYRITSDLF